MPLQEECSKCKICGHEFAYGDMIMTHLIKEHSAAFGIILLNSSIGKELAESVIEFICEK